MTEDAADEHIAKEATKDQEPPGKEEPRPSRDDKLLQKWTSQEHHADFVSTMTFASMHRGRDLTFTDCDCDECNVTLLRHSNGQESVHNEMIPDPILRAIHQHKRQKLLHGPMKRTQARTLMKRETLAQEQQNHHQVSVWHWTLPLNAEPLVEYGTSHRLVWVRRLSPHQIVKCIGTGIIGSGAEESTRPNMNWKQGGLYLVPSNEGRAVGFVNSSNVRKNENEQPPEAMSFIETDVSTTDCNRAVPVELVIAKVPPLAVNDKSLLQDDNNDEKGGQSSSSWPRKLCAAVSKLIQCCFNEKDSFPLLSIEVVDPQLGYTIIEAMK